MASNSFGNLFRITTWGESHGKAIGVVIDGCPAGVALHVDDINTALARRAPGKNPFTSPRKEPDLAEIYSGVFQGITTGAPISIIIHNKDADSRKYDSIKHLLRPGHANFTYKEKYGVFDYRGGGRASARETACRVAAGVVAEKLLVHHNIIMTSFMKCIGNIDTGIVDVNCNEIATKIANSPLFCPITEVEQQMITAIETAKEQGDSLGGIVEFQVNNMPIGFGEPIYEKLEAQLAKAMLSLPASKGFEIGEGFAVSHMKGSEHNDTFCNQERKRCDHGSNGVVTQSNHAGGTLGGISSGMPLIGRVAFKPTSSIKKSQNTVDFAGNEQPFQLPEGSRHDPCVAIRAVPIVKAMVALVLADAMLMNRCAKSEFAYSHVYEKQCESE